MTDPKFEAMLQAIAKANHTTATYVRQQMQSAMDAAMESKDPAIQERWASIPKKGSKLTLEELVAYIATQLSDNPT